VSVSPQELARRIERFRAACRAAGVKLTHQRIEIFREVAGSEEHPDAEAVFRGVRERVPTVSLDTVYRTLRLIEELGLVTTVATRRAPMRFDANLDSHHHFVCERCGMVRDFECADFDALKVPDEVKRLGTVSSVRVEARGVCAACAGEKSLGAGGRKSRAPTRFAKETPGREGHDGGQG
jgi:Fur family peroxide stress response transcriptional regulator